MNIECGKETIMCETVFDVLDKLCRVPERPISAPMRMPISGIYKIKGVGDVLAGRVEQGQVKPGEEGVFLPTHTGWTRTICPVVETSWYIRRIQRWGRRKSLTHKF